jgi:glycosyltransferase involved in cell wall biosynthesis
VFLLQAGKEIMFNEKIALVVSSLEIGGVATFVFNLACGLKKEGYEVEIVATESKGDWFDNASELQIPAICINYNKSLTGVSHARKVGYYLRDNGFSVCILNHARFAQAAIAMLPDEIKVFSIIHSDADWVYDVDCANSQAWNVAVTISHKLYETVLKRLPNKPIVEIIHGVEIPFQQPNKNESDVLNVVFIGRLSHEKGIFFLPEILKGCLKDGVGLTLTIVGDGPDRNALEKYFSAFPLAKITKLIGFVPHEEVNLLLDKADILLMPSLYEGLGIIMLEASAYGCVPIVSKLRGITDIIIEDGNNGFLVEPGDVNGFVKRLGSLYHDRSLLKQMSSSARSIAEQRLSVNRMVNEYSNLIQCSRRGEFALNLRRSELPQIDTNIINLCDHLPNILISSYRLLCYPIRCLLRSFNHENIR